MPLKDWMRKTPPAATSRAPAMSRRPKRGSSPSGVVREQEEEAGADHERDADRDATEGERAAGDVRRRRRRRCRRPVPDEGSACGREHERPHQRVAEPDAEFAREQEEAQRKARDAADDLPAAARRRRDTPRSRPFLLRDRDRRDDVQEDTDSSGGRRRDERGTHDDRLDSERARDTRANARDETLVAGAAQRSGRRRTQRRRPFVSPSARRIDPTVANSNGQK